ncbi:MAG: FAD-dependent monooxygenase [Gammaproteobacteria bacterium]|nr:FAD-dependent monooxygenase [Gammaproteobacteria bacterium]
MRSFQYDIMVLGRGIVGNLTSVLLADRTLRLAILDQLIAESDPRYFAFTEKTKSILDGIKLPLNWYPVNEVAIFGDNKGQLILQNVEGRALFYVASGKQFHEVLWQRVQSNPFVEILKEPASARLKVICEGQHSVTREKLKIPKNSWSYQQIAMAGLLCHTPRKIDKAFQWFHKGQYGLEILALLPIGEIDKSAIVWSMPLEKAEVMIHLTAPEQVALLNEISEPHLTGFNFITTLHTWDIQKMRVDQWSGRDRENQTWVLVGDSAHGIHPLAGLGLNLGIGDAKLLADVVMNNVVNHPWKGVDHLPSIRKYERQRKTDILWAEWVCDGLHGLFAHPDNRLHLLRNWGLNVLDRSRFLKELIVKTAV